MKTAEQLMARGLVPAEPLRQLMENWETDYRALAGNASVFLGNASKIAHLTGLKYDFIYEILSKKKDCLGFDAADKIVCCLSHQGWRWSDELYAIYSSFDFSGLDRLKPCTRLAA